jgi:hypothetical protein
MPEALYVSVILNKNTHVPIGVFTASYQLRVWLYNTYAPTALPSLEGWRVPEGWWLNIDQTAHPLDLQHEWKRGRDIVTRWDKKDRPWGDPFEPPTD